MRVATLFQAVLFTELQQRSSQIKNLYMNHNNYKNYYTVQVPGIINILKYNVMTFKHKCIPFLY